MYVFCIGVVIIKKKWKRLESERETRVSELERVACEIVSHCKSLVHHSEEFSRGGRH